MSNLVFLNALRDKLKGGNTKSIHLNVLPGRYASRFDLAQLNYISPGLADHFIDTLLTKPSFEFKISFDNIDLNLITTEEQKRLGLISKRLNSLHYENEDNYREHGIKTFGFGYPILIKTSKQDPKKIIKAPLFIWPLELIKSQNKVNTWSVLRNKIRNEKGKIVDEEIHSVGLNEVLLSFLKSDESISLPQINEDLLEDAVIDQEELLSECIKALKALNVDAHDTVEDAIRAKFSQKVQPIPEAREIEAITGNLPWIHFGGVFGLFRTQKESIITDIDRLIERFSEFQFDNLKVEKFSGTSHSAIETDPSQQEILNTLSTEPKKIIQGPPGTGKSQSLTALITNALANGLKCLVVCEKKTALEVIKNNLSSEDEQLGQLAALIEDINKDRDGIVSLVRDKLSALGQQGSFNEINYNNILQSIEKTAGTINQQHRQLDKNLLQGKAWTETVGEFLKRQKNVEASQFGSRLKDTQFSFPADGSELLEIVETLKTAQPLFSEINTLNHPLEILPDGLFLQQSARALQLQLDETSREWLQELKELLTLTEQEIQQYQGWLDNHYESYYSGIQTRINGYLSFVKSNEEQFGAALYKNDKFSRVKINTLSIVSRKYKTLKNNRRQLVLQIDEIREAHHSLKYFPHDYVEVSLIEVPTLKLFIENVEKLDSTTREWYRENEKTKKRFLEQFASVSLHPHYSNHQERIRDIETHFNAFAATFQKELILKERIKECSHLQDIHAEANRLISYLSVIALNLEDFREYYNWRKFYIQRNTLQQIVLRALIESGCTDWITAFEHWYLDRLLTISEHDDLPQNDSLVQQLFESKESLKQTQIRRIISHWTERQQEAVRMAPKKGVNPVSLYNKRGSKGERRNSLRKIVQDDFELFTSFYPVTMVSPTVCSSLLPLEEGIFDLIIFDEASQLRLEDTYPAMLRGKIKVVSGDSHQMPPSSYFSGGAAVLSPADDDNDSDEDTNTQTVKSKDKWLNLADSESLLMYSEDCGFKQSYLKIHYRSQHPHLIDFSNHAFYGKRLLPKPPRVDYKPIQYIQVNGLYEEKVNRDEARQVLDILLNHIKPFKNGRYPSVGVATFNLYQRNLILEEITRARQTNPEWDKKINELGPDLFVKNLENIQGDERDVIIISTTFGRKADGTFRQNFGPILQKNGYRLLNVIVTRAKCKIYVCSSVPEEHISQFPSLLAEKGNNGRGVFYAYLAYAKAVSDGNEEQRKLILDQLYEQCSSKSLEVEYDSFGSESPFEEEVYLRLATQIDQKRLEQQYKIGGFRIDLVVKSKISGMPVIAIECDGAKYHSSNEAWAWDMFRQKQLEQYGLKFYRIWSTNWWYAPDKELKKLVEYIQQYDRTETQTKESRAEDIPAEEIVVPVSLTPEPKKKVTPASLVTLKTPEGKVLKVKFSKAQSMNQNKPDKDGNLFVYERSPLALSLLNRYEGETCQLGMLEVYYEILGVE
jgi:very-short-patch-repair endonuclease